MEGRMRMKVKEQIVDLFRNGGGFARTSAEIAEAIDRPAPTTRRALVELRREGKMGLYDECRPFLYQSRGREGRYIPIYTYECDNGHEFDEIRPMAERESPAQCPECAELGGPKITTPATVVMDPARSVKGRKGGFR
jgi:putative FmdB family regulatory protein